MVAFIYVLWVWVLLIMFGGVFVFLSKVSCIVANVIFNTQINFELSQIDFFLWTIICQFIVWSLSLFMLTPIGGRVLCWSLRARHVTQREKKRLIEISQVANSWLKQAYGAKIGVNFWISSEMRPGVQVIGRKEIIISQGLFDGNELDLMVNIMHGHAKIYRGISARMALIYGAHIIEILIKYTIASLLYVFNLLSKIWIFKIFSIFALGLKSVMRLIDFGWKLLQNYTLKRDDLKADCEIACAGYADAMLDFLQKHKYLEFTNIERFDQSGSTYHTASRIDNLEKLQNEG